MPFAKFWTSAAMVELGIEHSNGELNTCIVSFRSFPVSVRFILCLPQDPACNDCVSAYRRSKGSAITHSPGSSTAVTIICEIPQSYVLFFVCSSDRFLLRTGGTRNCVVLILFKFLLHEYERAFKKLMDRSRCTVVSSRSCTHSSTVPLVVRKLRS